MIFHKICDFLDFCVVNRAETPSPSLLGGLLLWEKGDHEVVDEELFLRYTI